MTLIERLRAFNRDGDHIHGPDRLSLHVATALERLKGYAAHSDECGISAWMPRGEDPCPPCTCGLSALLREIDGC